MHPPSQPFDLLACVDRPLQLLLHPDDRSKLAYITSLVNGTRQELPSGARRERRTCDVSPLGSGSAWAAVRWVFRGADGQVLEDYPDSSLPGRGAGRWGSIGDTVHAHG